MMLVLADDFSGAAEIGGISHRYGLNTEVQLDLDLESKADLVVLDTNTRSMSRQNAISRTSDIAQILKNERPDVTIFKKVDSVLRGHIVDEINTLHRHFIYDRVLLLPANPDRGRKIIKGHYFINETSLDKTVFATDPDFPITSSAITSLIKNATLKHAHLWQGEALPETGLMTGDVESKNDIKNYIQSTTANDLCCGGAQCFEAFLENRGYITGSDPAKLDSRQSRYVMIMNGSTVRQPKEKELFQQLGAAQVPLPGKWIDDQFNFPAEDQSEWQAEVHRSLEQHRIVAISIDHTVKQNNEASTTFPEYFSWLITQLSKVISFNKLHLCLTGGATASAIMTSMNCKKLSVIAEEASGVVTLTPHNDRFARITVKPGSYEWPASFIKNL